MRILKVIHQIRWLFIELGAGLISDQLTCQTFELNRTL